jgi:hypothetical protein
VTWQTRPALRTGEFFEALDGARGDATGAASVDAIRDYADVFRLAEQPPA